MELSSPARQDFNPRISPIFFVGQPPPASTLSIVFSPLRCTPSGICSRSKTFLLLHVKQRAASLTLLFPLWHQPLPSTMPFPQALRLLTSCSCRSAFSNRCARVAPPRAAGGPASSPFGLRGSRLPVCNHFCHRRPSRSSIATTTLQSPTSRRSP